MGRIKTLAGMDGHSFTRGNIGDTTLILFFFIWGLPFGLEAFSRGVVTITSDWKCFLSYDMYVGRSRCCHSFKIELTLCHGEFSLPTVFVQNCMVMFQTRRAGGFDDRWNSDAPGVVADRRQEASDMAGAEASHNANAPYRSSRGSAEIEVRYCPILQFTQAKSSLEYVFCLYLVASFSPWLYDYAPFLL
jgi:hypothetical protein